MEALVPLVVVILIAIILLLIARRSRSNFESDYGNISIKEHCQSVLFFLIWMLILTGWMKFGSTSFYWFYGVSIFLGVPLIKSTPDRSIAWRIQETWFLAMIIMGPIILFTLLNN
ncbi:MAG: hypothetical protein KAQ91_06555 [Methylococcales bacterium]|nr:hypothetical protein [Methylococcales bacterium]